MVNFAAFLSRGPNSKEFRLRLPRFIFAACTLLALPAMASEKPEQLVIVSFDGAHDNALWVKSREMAKRTNAHFTYFLSCTFLKAWGSPEAKAYRAPHHASGKTATGFARSASEIAVRLDHIWNAHLEGHEIASHACGHFDGAQWSEADWTQEFDAFDTALRDGWSVAGAKNLEPRGWQDFVANGIKGFRAPYLSASPALAAAVRKHGFRYDASLITKGPALPEFSTGLSRFGLPLIAEGPRSKPVIAMDYNLYARHSGAKDDLEHGTRFEARSLAAYRTAFNQQYSGDRLPLQLGFHFVEMNGGAYWRALDTFLSETCQKTEVACVSYSEALERIKDRVSVEKADNGPPVASQF